MRKLVYGITAAIFALSVFVPDADCAADGKALQMAKGTYKGRFRGTVGNPHNNPATFQLKPKPKKRGTKATLNIPGGHLVKFFKITAIVRNGGDVVKFRGGRVLGTGLLPLGIEIREGQILKGSVNLGAGKPRLTAKMFLKGVDLTAGNAPVSGKPLFKGKN